jgi:hypothetical protein
MGCKGCQRCCDNPLPRRPPPNFSPLFFTNSLIVLAVRLSSTSSWLGFSAVLLQRKDSVEQQGRHSQTYHRLTWVGMVSISSAFISAHRRAWALCAMPNIAGSQGFWENISRDY